MDHVSSLSPLEEPAYVVKQVSSLTFLHLETVCVMGLSLTAISCEEIDLITLPTAWEVNTQTTVALSEVC